MATTTQKSVRSPGMQHPRLLATINPQGIDWSVYLEFAREPEDILHEAQINRHHIEPVGHCARLRYFGLKPFSTVDPADEFEVPLSELAADGSDFRDTLDEEHVIQNHGHPECMGHEAFLGNVSRAVFSALKWKTRRLGRVALTSGGRPMKKGWYPLFVEIDEIIQAGMSLPND